DTTPTPSSSSLNTKLSTTNRLLSLFKAKPVRFKRYKSFFQELQGRYGYLFEHLKAKFLSRKSFDTLSDHLQEVMVESLPTMVDKHIKEQVEKQFPEQAEISSQIQQAINNHIPSLVDESVRNNMSGHILHVHPAQPQTTFVPEQQYQLTFAVRPRDQDDPHDDAPPETSEYEAYSYASDDDEISMKQVSQDIMEEVSLTINEAELNKISDEICQRDPEAPALSLINQDLLYFKKGNSGPEKIVLPPHKFPAIIFNDVYIEEWTSRWVNKCVKKLNPYARYGVEHWKNPHAKIFYIKRQKEPGKPRKLFIQIQRSFKLPKRTRNWAMNTRYLLADHEWQESYQQNVNLTAPTISFPGIEKHKMFSIIYEPVHGIIYKNSKKEKRVMRHSEIHKFCDATLKSYNNDVKYGYKQRDLTIDEVEYLKLFEEEIEVRLKYRNQMRRWEMYVNRRPLGPRRERPE
ncbi:hypothetical protein Tco_1280746, partial [Tanacetum coccineum]